jgi:hypothetical protein
MKTVITSDLIRGDLRLAGRLLQKENADNLPEVARLLWQAEQRLVSLPQPLRGEPWEQLEKMLEELAKDYAKLAVLATFGVGKSMMME